MTGSHSIDYETLQSDAMRGVVRAVLARTAKSGLPGEHHFYIAFDTSMPGIGLSKRLKEKYPREMTIVLQHRFWDLIVAEDRFEVKLTFDGIPERLVVPFAAIKVFFDPSVRYGLQFEEADLGLGQQGITSNGLDDDVRTGPTRGGGARKPRSPRKPKAAATAEGADTPSATEGKIRPVPAAQPALSADTIDTTPSHPSVDNDEERAAPSQTGSTPGSGAQILDFDRLRKK